MYAELSDLVRVSTHGWDELAQRVVQDARVDGALLRAVAEGADVSGWPDEVVALAGEGLARIVDGLERASRHADTYITPRLGGVPLSPGLIAASDLPTVVATIAWRRLYGVAASDDIRKATAWADDYLRDFAAGRVSLGGNDPQGADPETYSDFAPRHITDAALRGF
jgi:phage gp36-like protein